MKSSKPWIRFRHTIYSRYILYSIAYLLTWFNYHPKLDRFPDAGKRQYLILMNHQTPYDQFFVGISFRTPIYYIATEDIFSLGFPSRVLEYTLAPIPIRKVLPNDLNTVKIMLKVIKEGGTICIAPEGNTTYSGYTGYMKPGIASLAKKSGLPIAIYKIEGGYGKHPRWADDTRKGPVHAGVSRVIEPEEYKDLTNEEFLELLRRELYVNECKQDASYTGKALAEYMERAVYVCPECGLSSFESSGDVCTCLKCGKSVQYLPDKSLKGVNNDFPFHYISEWYDYQCEFVNGLDPNDLIKEPVYSDHADVYLVDPCVNQKLIEKSAALSLYGDRIEVTAGDRKDIYTFEDITGAAILGRNRLEICVHGKIYKFSGSVHFNALKYLNFYHRYKNVMGKEDNGKFLGL